MGHGEKLTRKQDEAIMALLSETTIGAAALKVGVSEVTLGRWLKLPEFAAAYKEARRQVMEKSIAQLQNSTWAATSTLVRLLGSPSDSIRLRASIAILDQANKGADTLDFAERLAALEAKDPQ